MTTREFLEQLQAADVLVWVEGDRLRCNAPQGMLTPALQAELARRKPEIIAFIRAGSGLNRSLVPIHGTGSRTPFFAIPGHNGDVFCYVRLAHHLGDDQPFYALQPPGLSGERPPFTTIKDLAAHYVREMRDFLPRGPYLLGGYCAGGAVAFEVAQQLLSHGEDVGMLALFDSPFPNSYHLPYQFRNLIWYSMDRIPYHLRAIAGSNIKDQIRYLRDRVCNFARGNLGGRRDETGIEAESDFKTQVARATLQAVYAYRPTIFPGRIHLFLGSQKSLKQGYGRQRAWSAFAGGGHDLYVGPDGCAGENMLREPYAMFFADLLRGCLDRRGQGDNKRIGEDHTHGNVRSR